MNINKKIAGLAITTLIATTPIMSSAYEQSRTAAEANFSSDLVMMREEEKIARDVYRTLYASTQNRVFSKISQAEQRHMNAMANQLTRFGLADPVTNDATGVFNNPTFQTLYVDLIKRGQASPTDALYVGAYIEELDISDLQQAIAQSNDAQLNRVYENLMRGSRNHLRAFVRQLSAQGINTYSAQIMPQKEVDAILSATPERGHGGNRGMGKHQGHGNGMGRWGM